MSTSYGRTVLYLTWGKSKRRGSYGLEDYPAWVPPEKEGTFLEFQAGASSGDMKVLALIETLEGTVIARPLDSFKFKPKVQETG
jgi:hypothetical protein